jgi:hypothetical protein
VIPKGALARKFTRRKIHQVRFMWIADHRTLIEKTKER